MNNIYIVDSSYFRDRNGTIVGQWSHWAPDLTTTDAATCVEPPGLLTESLTVKSPAFVNAWVGFCSVDVLRDPEVGSPKSQDHDVGEPVEVSAKLTG